MPLSSAAEIRSVDFWVGLAFVSFPLNFLIYGWNDIVDAETDASNPRKDSFLFGARPDERQRKQLPWVIVGVTVLASVPLLLLGGAGRMAMVLLGIVGICGLYNHPRWGLRGVPPLELICQLAYLLVVPIAVWLNGAIMPDWPTFLYLSLFCIQSQIIGEVMDIEPDRATGRRTSATELGRHRAKLLIIAIVLCEVVLLAGLFGDALFAGTLLGFLVWLLLDAFVLYRDRAYVLSEMRLFGIGSNAVAFATMAYVWWSGCLLHLDGPLAGFVM
jgi:4-hydroxybenzoate polyprenyltransferase